MTAPRAAAPAFRRAGAMLAAGLLSLLLAASALAERRVALVIGNGAYVKTGALANPVSDAAAVADRLRQLGFDVVLASDLSLRSFRDALRGFRDRAADADVALAYYAGHGIEMDGVNYLIPVDADLAHSDDVPDEALSLARLRDAMTGARRLRVVILDACRDNPFLRSMRPSGRNAVGRGLGRIGDAAASEIIAFAAAEGSVAADGDGAHSPFTAALLGRLADPTVDVRFLFGGVYDDVRTATGRGAHAPQSPAIYAPNLGGRLVALVPPDGTPRPRPPKPDPVEPAGDTAAAPVPAPAAVFDPEALARRDFETAERLRSVAVWDAFLTTYPTGLYAVAAREARDRLAAAATPPAAVPLPPAEAVPPPLTPAPPAAALLSSPAIPATTVAPATVFPPPAAPDTAAPTTPGPLASLGRPVAAAAELDTLDRSGARLRSDGLDPVDGATWRTDPLLVWRGGMLYALRNTATAFEMRTVGDHGAKIRTAASAWRDDVVVSAGEDGLLRLWPSGGGGAAPGVLKGHTRPIASLWSINGQLLSGDDGGTIAVWDLPHRRLVRTLKGHADAVYALAATADGRFAVSASRDATLRVWDVATAMTLRILKGHDGAVTCVALSSDGRLIASGGIDGSVRIWDLASGRPLFRLWHDHPVTAIGFFDDHRVLAGDSSGEARIWNADTGAMVRARKDHTDTVMAVAAGGNGYTFSADHTLRVFAPNTDRTLVIAGLRAGQPVMVRSDGIFSGDGDPRDWLEPPPAVAERGLFDAYVAAYRRPLQAFFKDPINPE
jgi:hypothetical protein